MINIPKKEEIVSPKDFNKLSSKVEALSSDIDNKFDELKKSMTQQFKTTTKRIDTIEKELKGLKARIAENQGQIKEQIKIQEEIIMDMINKFDEKLDKEITKFTTEIEELKGEQDVLKISYTINEKKLLDKVKALIYSEIRNSVKFQEKEILMNMWIDELKDIVSQFEELKKLHPQEFNLRLRQISDILDVYKQKLAQ
ncbi:MAG: hypothetical protein GF383_02490 [Candidatus Lokiarchaeota archaeon]|nr:hypothetical protein [Candidatus Lokiarchaeota archaeon]MBD3338290.1 hypothetical protein [Candidatus Lokiarchaeota archaeon]